MTVFRVEVTDEVTGFFLSERLRRGAAVEVSDDDAWEVRVDADGQAGEVLDDLRAWLLDEGLSSARVYLDGKLFTLSVE